ncbi:MAG: 3-isopropylmalate dehydratase small subunit [Alphaproteobacteria bacterium GM7ARS4]|nr:3-isopropylmalate dehydratase small subunit [Alphaproteobacteria bacterium GM7ARS4]
MEAFRVIEGVAAPFMRENVDTDMIIPKQFLTTITRTGLGKGLFYDVRYEAQQQGSVFVLDEPRYKDACILVTGANFGCGSSREHAPWALLDAGYRCIIAPSFADIFYNNCFKNGMLPVALAKEDVASVASYVTSTEHPVITVDLPQQRLTLKARGESYPFSVDEGRKHGLLEGLDDIALTMRAGDAIDAFEEKDRQERPWLWSPQQSPKRSVAL